ncbi:hypothetical protein [Thermococcus sp.]
MKFEVLTKEDMNALSRELSRAGIMNRPREETTSQVEHYVLLRGNYREFLGIEIPAVSEMLEEVRQSFNEIVEGWSPSEERDFDEIFQEPSLGKLTVIGAMVEGGYVEENEGKLILLKRPKLEELTIELRFPIEELGDELETIEKKVSSTLVTEYTLEKRYYVEVLEVERELIEKALEIAETYATEESYVEAMFDGIARSVLAEKILEFAEKYRRKNELVEAIMGVEPITVEGKNERINIYYDEEAIEDFLKILQTLGYIKVKGNRIWI